MFIGPFLLIAALSGALYAVAPTVEAVMYKDVLTVEPTATQVPLRDQVQAAQAEHPEMPVAQIWPASAPGETTRVLLEDPALDEPRLLSVFVDPGTAAVVGEQPSYSGLGELPLRHWISGLHKDLNLGPAGTLYSELAASWMWFIACGGAYLWWKRTRTPRRAATGLPRARRTLNLHGVAGTWLLIAMLGLSATGITWSAVAGQNVSHTVEALGWKADPIATTVQQDGEPLTPRDVAAQADTVWRVAHEEGLTGSLRLFPPEDSATAWQASERWVPYRTSSDAISVDGTSGEVVDRLPFAELPLFSKLTAWGIYLHMGIMFGLPLQLALLAAAVGIAALVVTGYLMWWRRRPTVGAIAGIPGPTTALSGRDWAVIACLLATVGTFLPLFGVSLAVMVLVDRALAYRSSNR
ncbi:MAG TPA: PepSY domain-containing protein [Candidatus Corynebacterium gallistercoris]|uniref:PepSY domain-containing protein n=1 Tax=Candidatus Corynebacterium gallistercoris TaxID=2838530 RepID=A0A9D1UQN7_9CORY|nr:PepSY domain-containing protein [Candidatus Corynebacterium gallistercoris]